jgi:glycine/D-amino acid oxidase-like deaminating enzyme
VSRRRALIHIGVTNLATGVAFQARANPPAVAAGFFVGNVSVFGALGVSGGKFAVVKSADGKYHTMHAVEAPEAWFEDFGEGRLVNGSATVHLDPLFAQHIHTDGYQVFLTTYGASQGLDVVSRDAGGFTVQERNRGTSGVAFGYRVVGKRNDIKDERLPVWELPPGIEIPASSQPPGSNAPQPAPPARALPTIVAPQGSSTRSPVQPAPAPRP